LESLVGSPTDGIQFNLFGIVDRNEEVLLAVGDELHKTFLPRLTGVETTTQAVEKLVKAFNANVGGDVLAKLAAVENSVKALEATSSVSLGPTFEQVRKILIDEIIPAMTDMWDLYMLSTAGPGQAVRPGSGKPPGEYLWAKLEARPNPQRQALGFGANNGNLEQRLTVMEDTLALFGVAAVPQIPSIFGVQPQGNGGGCAVAASNPPTQDVVSLAASLVGLEAKVKDLDSQLGNTTITCSSLTFHSVDECDAFILEFVPGNTYAHFYDMVLLLQRGWGETHISVSDVWEKLYNMKRAGFTCKGEAVISASMNTILPTCLGELTGKNSKSTSPLPGLPTHSHWTSKGGQLGWRRDIAHCLANVKPTLDNQQLDYFQGNWMGGAVAKELLTKSFAHWTYFQTMLDDFYMEFAATGS
jgi:hypothetical protein